MSADYHLQALFGDTSPAGMLAVLVRALEQAPLGVGILRADDLTFIYANPVYESWFQSDRRPLAGRRLEDSLVAAPSVVSTFRDVADRGQAVHFQDAEFSGLKGSAARAAR